MSKSASLATATDSSLRIRRVGVFLGAEITGIRFRPTLRPIQS